MGAKIAWKFYEKPSALWARIIRTKYLDLENSDRIFTMRNPPVGFAMWNFLVKSREIVLSYLSCIINLGVKALFWLDSWNIYPALNSLGKFSNSQVSLERLWGTNVQDYLCILVSEDGCKARWKIILDGVILVEEKSELVKIFNQRSIFISEEEEKLIWSFNKSGKHSVKEGYSSLLKGRFSTKSREFSLY